MPGIGPKTLKILEQMGLKTVQDLQKTPLEALRRFLPDGPAYALHALAFGRQVPRYTSRSHRISREVTLEEDREWNEELQALFLGLADDVAMALVSENQWAMGVGVRVRYPDFKTVSRQQRLPEATRDPRVLFQVGQQLIRPLVRGHRVRLVGIAALFLVRHPPLSLFGPEPQDLARVLQQVRETYGPQAVRFARELLEPIEPRIRFGRAFHGQRSNR